MQGSTTVFDPLTFSAKLAGGKVEEVIKVPLTEPQGLIARKQVRPLTKELSGWAHYKEFNPQVLRPLSDAAGEVYGVPQAPFAQGLVYNRDLFTKAGLDPDKPPATWDEVRAAAKAISARTGKAGFVHESKNNQGGWQLTMLAYTHGGEIEREEGGRYVAAFNADPVKKALGLLKEMRWTDDSMGDSQLNDQNDVIKRFAAGEIGMYMGTPGTYRLAKMTYGMEDTDAFGRRPAASGRRERHADRRRRLPGAQVRDRGEGRRGGEVAAVRLRRAAVRPGRRRLQGQGTGRRPRVGGRGAHAADVRRHAAGQDRRGRQAVRERQAGALPPLAGGHPVAHPAPRARRSGPAGVRGARHGGPGGAHRRGRVRGRPAGQGGDGRQRQTRGGQAVSAGRAGTPAIPLPAVAASPAVKRGRHTLTALLFLVPALVVFGVFSWWPIVRGLLISFQETNLVDAATWVGLDNFRALFADPLLGTAVANTLLFVGLALLIGFPAPLVLAVVLSTVRRGAGVYRFLVYLPVVVPPVVAILLWKWFYDPGHGLFNGLLALVGLGPYPWLDSPDTAMLSLVLQSTWAGMGGAVLIYLAAIVG
ncbi:extracellular solute-binding protein, partial [Nonomuraea rubra]|uniref:extracellular solute-binding protein n=1 Tax=Nonomuraea rubra TaxID=46180 RepID=UPI0031F0A2F4